MEQILVFGLGEGEDLYALEVANLQEVVESPPLHYIPRAPEHFEGAINYHGTVLPVLDLSSYLGFPEKNRDPRIVVLAFELCRMALRVASVHKIISVDPAAFQPAGEEDQTANIYVRTVIRREEDDPVIKLLDVARLLASLEHPRKWGGGRDGA
jgi:purine-binding chemotaxis protein CheW